ncbi:MAG: hypothetical protein H8D23_04760 [Candidatus Brocadiales bacterium]|nr:hypothetical protein [Candidatus Brocadiales bacterium]
MNQAFKDEIIKLSAKKDNADFKKGLIFGAGAGVASVVSTHPIEHNLYGNSKTGPFFPHLGKRLTKGVLASAVGYGTYHYLSNNEDKIKDWGTSVKDDTKKYFK